MSIIWPVLGIGVLLFVAFDMIQTTMGSGGGPLTKRLTHGLWLGVLRLSRPRPNHAVLSFAGVLVTLFAVALWILLWWLGWSLIFMGTFEAVAKASTNMPAGFWERIYFTGFTVYTLGLGDYVPQGTVWRLLTVTASVSGLFIVTFSITYLVPIVQAATQKRQLSVYIASIGSSPAGIILNTKEGAGGIDLGRHLQTITPLLAGIEQRHLSYPVMHYFHSRTRSAAIAVTMSALDEALTIVELGFEGDGWIDKATLRPARQVMTEFLDLLQDSYIRPHEEVPPAPDLERLREEGLPVVDQAEFEERVGQLQERRRLLRAFVENDGWHWEDVTAAERSRHPMQPLS